MKKNTHYISHLMSQYSILNTYYLLLTTFSLLLTTFPCFSQALPSTEIWLFDIISENGKLTFNNPVNITNRDGYDNQPAFSPDGSFILYTGMHEGKQTDIYKYEIDTKITTKITSTPESEYSPTFMPESQYISTVKVEKSNVQRVWKFKLEEGNKQELVFDIDSVGYHTWVSKDSLVIFLLGDPTLLALITLSTKETDTIADQIGRSLVYRNEHLYFTDQALHECNITATDLDKTFDEITACYGDSEDFIMYNNFVFIMGQQTELFRFESSEKGWQKLVDLRKVGLNKISRIAISSDGKRIALVDEK